MELGERKEIKWPHPIQVSYSEAVAIQNRLKRKVMLDVPLTRVECVAGVDVSYQKGTNMIYAAVLVFDYVSMKLLDRGLSVMEATYPYIPGLLSFREGPAVMEAFGHLSKMPDVIIFDGQGIAHPRFLGLAAHVGVLLDIPSVGCAKKKLVGEYVMPATTQGSMTSLLYDGLEIGKVVRTRKNVKPVFVSQGHKIRLKDATRLVLASCRGYRLPEPTRQAHKTVNMMRLSNTHLKTGG